MMLTGYPVEDLALRATTRDGRELAVKVLYPDIERLIANRTKVRVEGAF